MACRFFAANPIAQRVTTTTAAATKMSAVLLNSGNDGVGVGETVAEIDGDVVGFDDASAVLTYTFPV